MRFLVKWKGHKTFFFFTLVSSVSILSLVKLNVLGFPKIIYIPFRLESVFITLYIRDNKLSYFFPDISRVLCSIISRIKILWSLIHVMMLSLPDMESWSFSVQILPSVIFLRRKEAKERRKKKKTSE